VILGEAVAGDRFGAALAWLNGNLLVGAMFRDDGGTDAGAIYIFRDDGSGIMRRIARVDGTRAGDNLGIYNMGASGSDVLAAAFANSRGGVDGAWYSFSLTYAGYLTGTGFNDQNKNGIKDAGEPPLTGWTAYLDANDNGVKDAGESSSTTDLTGGYVFNDLAPGTAPTARSMPH